MENEFKNKGRLEAHTKAVLWVMNWEKRKHTNQCFYLCICNNATFPIRYLDAQYANKYHSVINKVNQKLKNAILQSLLVSFYFDLHRLDHQGKEYDSLCWSGITAAGSTVFAAGHDAGESVSSTPRPFHPCGPQGQRTFHGTLMWM